MRIGNFSSEITGGNEHSEGHVGLAHEQVYGIRLTNHWANRRCDALVEVDGKPVGAFRLGAGGMLILERPADDDGRFTFYRSGSNDAKVVGEASIEWENRGLVRVKFQPEYEMVREEKTSGIRGQGRCMSFAPDENDTVTKSLPQNASAGVTGLSGRSSQEFHHVPPLKYDPSNEVTITLRLVCVDDGPRPLEPVKERGNKVPAPVG